MDALELVTTWLQAVDAGDWQTVWECHAPDSLILAAHQVLPRQHVAPQTYVQTQRTIAARQAPDHRRRFVAGKATWHPVPDQAVVLVDLTDTVSGVACQAAFLVGATGITGIVVDPPSPGTAALEAAADLVQVPGSLDWRRMHLSALHHSFARRRLGFDQAVRTLPEQRFTCQGRGDCCHVGKWQASLSDNDRLAADALVKGLHLPALAFREPPSSPGFPSPAATDLRHHLAPAAITGACTLLDAACRCRVHGDLGWQPLPVCASYPLIAVATPDGLDVTASFTCETVCRNQGAPLTDQVPALRTRLWPLQHRLRHLPDRLRCATGHPPTMPWSEYRALETTLLAHLADLPIRGETALTDGSTTLATVLGTAAPRTGWTVDRLVAGLLTTRPPGTGNQHGWLDEASPTAWQAVRDADIRLVDDGEMMSRFLRSVLFRKPGLPEAGIGHAWGVTLLVHRLAADDARHRALRAGRNETDATDVLAAIRATETLVGHARLAQTALGLPGYPLESPAMWAALMAPS